MGSSIYGNSLDSGLWKRRVLEDSSEGEVLESQRDQDASWLPTCTHFAISWRVTPPDPTQLCDSELESGRGGVSALLPLGGL